MWPQFLHRPESSTGSNWLRQATPWLPSFPPVIWNLPPSSQRSLPPPPLLSSTYRGLVLVRFFFPAVFYSFLSSAFVWVTVVIGLFRCNPPPPNPSPPSPLQAQGYAVFDRNNMQPDKAINYMTLPWSVMTVGVWSCIFTATIIPANIIIHWNMKVLRKKNEAREKKKTLNFSQSLAAPHPVQSHIHTDVLSVDPAWLECSDLSFWHSLLCNSSNY